MRMQILLAAAALALASVPAVAQDDRPSLADLLAQGYEIKATELVPEDILQRAMGEPAWKDDLLITLQRGSTIAFCHGLLQATTNTSWFVGIPCTTSDATVPAATSEPVAPTEPASAPAETAPAETPTAPPAETPATN